MPIEIRELHIRVSVGTSAGSAAPAASAPAAGTGASVDKALVAECVEQVLQVLRDQKER